MPNPVNETELVAARRQSLIRAMDLTGLASAFTLPAAIATILALRTDLRSPLALLFLSGGVTLTIAATLIVRRFKQHIDDLGPLGDDSSSDFDVSNLPEQARWLSTWETIHALMLGCTGCLWSMPMWFQHPDRPTISPLLFSIAAAAVCLGICAPAKRSYLAFMVCIVSQTVVAMSIGENAQVRLIPAAILFGFIMVLMSAMIADTFTEAFVLRAQHEGISRQLKQSNKKLALEVDHDRLTSLPNRARLLELADRHLARTRGDETLVAVLFIDLDRFKVVNDSFGHDVGDFVLVEVARRLEAAVRPGDIVGRLGGDEFIGILPMIPNAKVAIEACTRIKEALDIPIVVGDQQLHVGACIGLTLGKHTDEATELIRQADTAMYRAKLAGRGRIELFDESIRRMVDVRVAQEHAIRNAIARDDLVAWYQPCIEVTTGRVLGVEMLIRWIDPERGIIPASEFIDIADEAGLMDKITATLAERAMNDCADWERTGVIRPAFDVAINVTGRQVARPGGLDGILAVLRSGVCSPQHFSIEIRELTVKDDLRTAGRQLKAIRDLGAKVTLDNFGSGAGSLSLLRELPLNAVKIDGSLLRMVERESGIAASVKSAIYAATQLGLSTHAAGIETDQQLELIRNLGITVAQGYLWSDALPANQIADYVDAREYVAETLRGLL